MDPVPRGERLPGVAAMIPPLLLPLLAACAPLSNALLLVQEAEEAVPGPGGACDCTSLFPMCEGASWVYDVFDLKAVSLSTKDWYMRGQGTDFDLTWDAGTPPLTKHLDTAWSFGRSTVEDVRQAWLTEDETAVYWEDSKRFSADGSNSKIQYYKDRRVRLYKDLWSGTRIESYLEYTAETVPPGEPAISVTLVETHWRVEDLPAVVLMDARFGARAVVCQVQETMYLTPPFPRPLEPQDTGSAWEADEVAHFCFARGIGKVWESTEGDQEELLTDWNVPGCL